MVSFSKHPLVKEFTTCYFSNDKNLFKKFTVSSDNYLTKPWLRIDKSEVTLNAQVRIIRKL